MSFEGGSIPSFCLWSNNLYLLDLWLIPPNYLLRDGGAAHCAVHDPVLRLSDHPLLARRHYPQRVVRRLAIPKGDLGSTESVYETLYIGVYKTLFDTTQRAEDTF